MLRAVSVVVPVYKAEKFLAECVESVLAQSVENFEIILVDDGSPDRAGAICDDFAARDSRVRVFHQKNSGVSAARKNGVAHARGEWICFVDADDVLAPAALETLLNFADPETDLIEGAFEFFDDGAALPAFPSSAAGAKLAYAEDAVGYAIGIGRGGHRGFSKAFGVMPWGKIIRRALLTEEILSVPAEFVYGEDTIFLLRLSARGLRFAKKIDACVLAARKHGDSASFSPIRRDEKYLLKMYGEMTAAVAPFPEKKREKVLHAIAFHAKRHMIGALVNQRVSAYEEWLAILRHGTDGFSLDPRKMFFCCLLVKWRILALFRPIIFVYSVIQRIRKS